MEKKGGTTVGDTIRPKITFMGNRDATATAKIPALSLHRSLARK